MIFASDGSTAWDNLEVKIRSTSKDVDISMVTSYENHQIIVYLGPESIENSFCNSPNVVYLNPKFY